VNVLARTIACLAVGGVAMSFASGANAASCFGEFARPYDSGGSIRLGQAQTAVIVGPDRTKVDAAGTNLICSKRAPVVLRLGGGGSSKVKLGPGDDLVKLIGKIKHNERRTIWTGLGDDVVKVTGRGHTVTYLSPRKVSRDARDTDSYSGNQDIDTVYDFGGGTDERPNVIKGNRALDYLHSAGTARSDVYGGDGTDYLYVNSRGDGRDRIFGDRGNDRLNAEGGGKNSNGVYMDGAEGDDWYFGSAGPDTMLSLSGVKKLYGNAGDDTFIRTAIGKSKILGGPGRDTLSYMGHIPPGWGPGNSGVFVNLRGRGTAVGGDEGEDRTISSIEHVIGSAFDDQLDGREGKIQLDGGLGNDRIQGSQGNRGDGGLGRNMCVASVTTADWLNCSLSSFRVPHPDELVLDVGEDAVPVVLGSEGDDSVDFSYDDATETFRVVTSSNVLLSGSCQETETAREYSCPVDPDLLTIAMISTGDGEDSIDLDSIPDHMNVIVDGGDGIDSLRGTDSREVTFNVERGFLGKGNDQIWMAKNSTLNAGSGSDTVHMTVMCVGGNVKGGPGVRDGIVFAGLKRGVWASMESREARYLKGPCAKPFRFADDWEGLEGTRENDILIGSNERGITFLGRDGVDVFKARNGKFDKITVGGEGRRNRVIADPKDRIHWDWGYAAF